jgi:hypothetical protein
VRFQKHSFLLVLLNISSSICQNQGHCARNAAKKTEVVRKASKRDKVRDENTFGITKILRLVLIINLVTRSRAKIILLLN